MTHYEQCIANGCSEKLAEMLASGRPPAINTDTRMASRHSTIAKQFADKPAFAEKLAKRCRKVGFELGANDVYNHAIAKGVCDPKAVVKSHEVRASTRKAAEERGCGMQDADMNWIVKPRELINPPKRKRIRIADDLIQARYEERVEKDPGLKKLSTKEKRELRNEIISQHGSR